MPSEAPPPRHPRLSLIAAVGRGGVIGDGQGMPWHLPQDLAFFKRTTMGGVLVMGRGTWDSIGRALPGRSTIVLTRDPDWSAPGALVAHSLEEALASAAHLGAHVFSAGGGQIYRQTLALADRLLVTHVDQDTGGSVTFPAIDPAVWVETERTPGEGLAFVTYERVGVSTSSVSPASSDSPVASDSPTSSDSSAG